MAFGEETIREISSRVEALLREYTGALSKAIEDQNGKIKIGFKVDIENIGVEKAGTVNHVEIEMKFKPAKDVSDTSCGSIVEPIRLRKE